jgi:hypothetical protein
MTYIIANGLEEHNPVAYLLVFVLLYPPVFIILWTLIEAIIDKIRKH